MARDLVPTDQPVQEQAPDQEHPKEGGSYTRDPKSTALKLVEQTKPAVPAEKE